MIPFDVFTQIPPGKHDEDTKRDYFLNDFQLKRREFAIADAIRRNLKTIFRERDQPAQNNGGKKWSFAIFQVTVPRDCHEDI